MCEEDRHVAGDICCLVVGDISTRQSFETAETDSVSSEGICLLAFQKQQKIFKKR